MRGSGARGAALAAGVLVVAARPAVLERGGAHGAEAASGDVPEVVVDGGQVVAWGMTEVPAGARRSAAVAAVEALTRAELTKYLGIEVESRMEDGMDSAGAQTVRLETRQRVEAALRGAVPVTTGWAKLRRGDEVVLRWVGRAEVSLDRLRALASGAPPATARDDAPGWARRGDAKSERGHRFVCEGQGETEDEALAVARALCDDKICRLCGVEIEARLETVETLDGVDVERKVVERCRRVRKGDTPLTRRSLDCGPDGCAAWILIDYPERRREEECRAAVEGDFDDPAACMADIDAFAKIEGWTAASFRARVKRLESAKTACANIDVRPTPRLQALDKRLRDGMATWRTRRTPRYLARYWLKDHPPMWDAFGDSPSFTERLDILLGYLRSKPPLLDVIEAAAVDDEVADTPQGVGAMLDALKRAPRAPGYGVEGIHRVVLQRVAGLHREGRLTVDVAPLGRWVRATFPPATADDWSDVTKLYGLFGADDLISEEEWAYARSAPERWRLRFLQELLEVKGHGRGGRASPGVRRDRFFEALELALDAKDDPEAAFRAVMPRPAPGFFLEVAPDLPDGVNRALEYETLERHLPDLDDFVPREVTQRFGRHLFERLARMPIRKLSCNRLYKRLERLEAAKVPMGEPRRAICGCLGRPEASYPTVNLKKLYDRALEGGYPCVAPL